VERNFKLRFREQAELVGAISQSRAKRSAASCEVEQAGAD